MKRRALSLSLLIITASGWWVLRLGPAATPEPMQVAPNAEVREPVAAVRHDEPPTSVERAGPTAEPVPIPSDPLARQRRRLLDTSASLAVRLAAARTSGAPERTLQALDAHLARIEQRLATLDTAVTGAIADDAASATPSAVRRP
jgi:hypothetical protein